jgi:hypothetical protein
VPIHILVHTFFTRALGLDARLLKRYGERGRFLW